MNKVQKVRASHDRRDDDQGPPSGWKERRRTAERRIPSVEETDMSETEWLSYFGSVEPKAPATGETHDIAAEILGKSRR
jgi:hypothetical protein